MDSFEINKFVGAILVSILVVMGISMLGGVLIQPHYPEEPAYKVEIAEKEAAPAAEAAPEAAAEEGPSLAALLADASAESGSKVAKKCAACHSFDEGGPTKIGPNLFGVLGRDIASVAGFGYSGDLAAKEGAWDYAKLNAFLTKPKDFAPGTKMAFAGLKKDGQRADLILYLRSLGSGDTPLPAAE